MVEDDADLAQRIERVNRLKTQTAKDTYALREEAQRLAEQVRRRRHELQAIEAKLRIALEQSKGAGATVETDT